MANPQDGNPQDGRRREQDLVDAALERPPGPERERFLREACGGDTALFERVIEGIREMASLGDFLETPAVRWTGNASLPGSYSAGDVIGPYTIVETIGEGGCGVVYLASQEHPVRRRVALKVIKPGMDTAQVIARFQAERQALAILDHPSIARVLDAGATDSGRPYFVMEWVRGTPITEHCDTLRRSPADRLRLFLPLCHAIQHAHQKGVIHRDIKPTNVLVTAQDGKDVPKVIDFGIAKATGERLSDRTILTGLASFLGTPAYMSPEQASMAGDVDTRTDIYSLGILLHELLTGCLPFDPRQLVGEGVDACRRRILHEDPPPPSACVASLPPGEQARLAALRAVEPSRWATILRRDLDWIVMRCLEKDRARRYPTASNLAEDIQRFLNGEPILARPPSASYRLAKHVRRHGLLVASGATVAFALLAGAAFSSRWAIQANRARQEQAVLRRQAEAAEANEVRLRSRAEADRLTALRQAYHSDMNLVQQALAAHNHGRVLDLLERQLPMDGHPDLRQWEWWYFQAQTRSDALRTIADRIDPVLRLFLSAPGNDLLTLDQSGRFQLWHLDAADVAGALLSGGATDGWRGMAAVALPDNKGWAVALSQGPFRSRIEVWDPEGTTQRATWPTPGGIDTLGVTPGGDALHGLRGESLHSWDLPGGQLRSTFPLPTRRFGFRPAGAFSPDASRVALADDNGRVHILDTETGASLLEVHALDGYISCLAFAPDGHRLAAAPAFGNAGTAIHILDAASGQPLTRLEGHASWVWHLAFTPDGSRLVSVGADQTVRVWEIDPGRPAAVLRGHRSEVHAVAVRPGTGTVVTGGKDGQLLEWPLADTGDMPGFRELALPAVQIAFLPGTPTPGAPTLLLVLRNGHVAALDLPSARLREWAPIPGDPVIRAAANPAGDSVALGLASGAVRIWDPASDMSIEAIPAEGWPRLPLGWLDSGRTLVVLRPGPVTGVELREAGSWSLLAAWEGGAAGPPRGPPPPRPGNRPPGSATGRTAAPPPPPGQGFQNLATLSPDGHLVLLPDAGGGAVLHDTRSGRRLHEIQPSTWGYFGAGFSPDGSLLALASIEGTVTLVDARNFQPVEILRGHLLGVHSVAFSPDNQRIASGSNGIEAVKLWDTATLQEVATLPGSGVLVLALAYSDDGEWLAGMTADGRILLWHAPASPASAP